MFLGNCLARFGLCSVVCLSCRSKWLVVDQHCHFNFLVFQMNLFWHLSSKGFCFDLSLSFSNLIFFFQAILDFSNESGLFAHLLVCLVLFLYCFGDAGNQTQILCMLGKLQSVKCIHHPGPYISTLMISPIVHCCFSYSLTQAWQFTVLSSSVVFNYSFRVTSTMFKHIC